MCNKIIRSLSYIVILSLFLVPFVFAAEDQPISDVMQKIMQSVQKNMVEDINRNVDENFGQLDQRIMDKNTLLFRKAIFALIGGLAVVIFGYAYIQNRITKNYDINFYEKMIDSKLSKLQGLPYVISTPSTFYTSVTRRQFDERYSSSEKYFDRFTMSDQIENMKKEIERLNNIVKEKGIKVDSPTFYSSVLSQSPGMSVTTQDTKSKQGIKLGSKNKLILFTCIGVVVIVVVYYLFRKPTDTSIISFFGNMFSSVFKSIQSTNITGR